MTLEDFEREYVKRYVIALAKSVEKSEVQILLALNDASKFGIFQMKRILRKKLKHGRWYSFSIGKSPNEILFELWKTDAAAFNNPNSANSVSWFYLCRRRAEQLLDTVKMKKYKGES